MIINNCDAEPGPWFTEFSAAAAHIEQWEREMGVTLGDAELTESGEIDITDVSLRLVTVLTCGLRGRAFEDAA